MRSPYAGTVTLLRPGRANRGLTPILHCDRANRGFALLSVSARADQGAGSCHPDRGHGEGPSWSLARGAD
jgi:hypothetical protein